MEDTRQVEGEAGNRDPKRRGERGWSHIAADAGRGCVSDRLGEFTDRAPLHFNEDLLGLAAD